MPLVEMKGITKKFSGVIANNNVEVCMKKSVDNPKAVIRTVPSEKEQQFFAEVAAILREGRGKILYTVCRELSWSHIRLIMRLDNEKARGYYINESRSQNWSVRVLERNMRSGYFERLLSSQKAELPAAVSGNTHAANLIKDPYVLEFLGLPENAVTKETKLENAIIGHLQEFLFGTVNITRNSIIASMFFRIDYIEQMGTGIRRMRNAAREANVAEPEFEFTGFFKVTFKRNEIDNSIGRQSVAIGRAGR